MCLASPTYIIILFVAAFVYLVFCIYCYISHHVAVYGKTVQQALLYVTH